MKTKRWPLFLFFGCLLGSSFLAAADNDHSAANIQQLIAQLGDDQYVRRQLAEKQLLERGAKAFAMLKEATSNVDLEIATRAKYILTQINIDWVRQSDPPVVRTIMARYGELLQPNRLAIIGKLSRLEHEQGFGVLCRIARFESSGLSARYAALAILEKGFLPPARVAAAVTTLTKEMGDSDGIPVSWVRVYADQLQSPQKVDPRWLLVIDEEIESLADEASDTSQAQLLTLLSSYLDICDRLSDAEAIVAGLQRRINLGVGRQETLKLHLIDALTWLSEHEQWGALDLLEDRYSESIKEERLLVYYVAAARGKQGRSQEAEVLAKVAFRFEVPEAVERNRMASILTDFGRHDWAEREWRFVIETVEPTELQSLLARQSLALFRLYDRLEYLKAVDLLTDTIDAINDNPEIKQAYQSDKELQEELKRFRSNREFISAAYEESQENFQQQRRHLEQAYRLEKDNADILIAMFHLQGASETYRQTTRKRLAIAKGNLEKGIKEINRLSLQRRRITGMSVLLSHRYNHWAWLVSNTEGDFAKAVRYSQRSLEFSPGSATYLDTLGRCYFSAGDIENATKVQREAVAKHPHMQVMRRQLKFFEDELQKRQNGEAGE